MSVPTRVAAMLSFIISSLVVVNHEVALMSHVTSTSPGTDQSTATISRLLLGGGNTEENEPTYSGSFSTSRSVLYQVRINCLFGMFFLSVVG